MDELLSSTSGARVLASGARVLASFLDPLQSTIIWAILTGKIRGHGCQVSCIRAVASPIFMMSLYLYLYLHIYTSLYDVSMSTSLPSIYLSIHLSIYIYNIYIYTFGKKKNPLSILSMGPISSTSMVVTVWPPASLHGICCALKNNLNWNGGLPDTLPVIRTSCQTPEDALLHFMQRCLRRPANPTHYFGSYICRPDYEARIVLGIARRSILDGWLLHSCSDRRTKGSCIMRESQWTMIWGFLAQSWATLRPFLGLLGVSGIHYVTKTPTKQPDLLTRFCNPLRSIIKIW